MLSFITIYYQKIILNNEKNNLPNHNYCINTTKPITSIYTIVYKEFILFRINIQYTLYAYANNNNNITAIIFCSKTIY